MPILCLMADWQMRETRRLCSECGGIFDTTNAAQSRRRRREVTCSAACARRRKTRRQRERRNPNFSVLRG